MCKKFLFGVKCIVIMHLFLINSQIENNPDFIRVIKIEETQLYFDVKYRRPSTRFYFSE
jgi:hypothetical protein